jgi:hypothetical protein
VTHANRDRLPQQILAWLKAVERARRQMDLEPQGGPKNENSMDNNG